MQLTDEIQKCTAFICVKPKSGSSEYAMGGTAFVVGLEQDEYGRRPVCCGKLKSVTSG